MAILDVMSFFQKAYADRSLDRQERRAVDRIVLMDKDLDSNVKKLQVLCTSKEVTIPRLAELQKKINKKVGEITAQLHIVMTSEYEEFNRDIKEPFSAVESLLPLLNQYESYVQEAGFFSQKDQELFVAELTRIKELLAIVYSQIEQALLTVKEVYERELQNSGSSRMLSDESIDKLMTVAHQWEQEKMRLSQQIRSLVKKLSDFKREIERRLTEQKRKNGERSIQKLLNLEENQKKEVQEALSLLKKEEARYLLRGGKEKLVLSSRSLRLIERSIKLAREMEREIVQEMERLGIPTTLSSRIGEASGEEKKVLQQLSTKLKFTPTKTGLPIQFWLGEQRALGYLQAGDMKNLDWLHTLLEKGLLAEDGGMLAQRVVATKGLLSMGIVHVVHDNLLEYVQEYSKQFEILGKHIVERVGYEKGVMGHLGATLFQLDHILMSTFMEVDTVLVRLEKEDKQKEAAVAQQPVQAAKLEREIGSIEKQRVEERKGRDVQEGKLIELRRKMVADTTTMVQVLGEDRKKVNSGLSLLNGRYEKVAAGIVALMMASQVAFGAVPKGEAIAESRPVAVSSEAGHFEEKTIVDVRLEAEDYYVTEESRDFIDTTREVRAEFQMKGFLAFGRFNPLIQGKGSLDSESQRLKLILEGESDAEGVSLQEYIKVHDVRLVIDSEAEACNIGPASSNLKLSFNRAGTIGKAGKTALQAIGVPSSRIQLNKGVGKGEVDQKVFLAEVFDDGLMNTLSAEGQQTLKILRADYNKTIAKSKTGWGKAKAYNTLVNKIRKSKELDQVYNGAHRSGVLKVTMTYNRGELKEVVKFGKKKITLMNPVVVTKVIKVWVPDPVINAVKSVKKFETTKAVLPSSVLVALQEKKVEYLKVRGKGREGFQKPEFWRGGKLRRGPV